MTTTTTPTTPALVAGPGTDLTVLVGARCTITTTVSGIRYAHTGQVYEAWHSLGEHTGLGPHAGAFMLEEPHEGCRGGNTCLYLGYGDATIEVL